MGTSVDRLDHADRSTEPAARIVTKITQPIIDLESIRMLIATSPTSAS
jgi:hypothetical protein